MHFRKAVLAIVITGIGVIPQTAFADTVLSGAVDFRIRADDADEPILIESDEENEPDLDTGLTSSDPEIDLGDALLGLVATHTTNNGLSAYGSVRYDGEGFSGSNATVDNVYIGVKGGFGDIRIGEVPVAAEYGQVVNDIFDQTDSVNEGISYTGGFGLTTVGVTYSPARNEDVFGVGVKFNVGGFAFGIGGEERDNLANFSVGAAFGFFGASFTAHIVNVETDDGLGDTNIFAAKVGYGFAGTSFRLTHFTQILDGGDGEEATTTRFDIGYGLGGGFKVSARYNLNDGDVDGDGEGGDPDDWRLSFSKSF